MTNCPAHIAKNPRGHWGRGFRGPGSGGTWGDMPGYKKENPRGVVEFYTAGAHPKLHISRANNSTCS